MRTVARLVRKPSLTGAGTAPACIAPHAVVRSTALRGLLLRRALRGYRDLLDVWLDNHIQRVDDEVGDRRHDVPDDVRHRCQAGLNLGEHWLDLVSDLVQDGLYLRL